MKAPAFPPAADTRFVAFLVPACFASVIYLASFAPSSANPGVTIEEISIPAEFEVNYQQTDNFIGSPDGRRIAYVATQGSRKRVVVDGRSSPPYAAVKNLIFTSDSAKLVFVGRRGESDHLVTITRDAVTESAGVDSIQSIAVAPQGATVFAQFIKQNGARRGTQAFLNQQECSVEGGGILKPAQFSPDGSLCAFVVYRDVAGGRREHRIVINGVAGPAMVNWPLLDVPFQFAHLEGEPCVLKLFPDREGSTGTWIAQFASGRQKVLQRDALVHRDLPQGGLIVSADGRHFASVQVQRPANPDPVEVMEGKVRADYRVFRNGEQIATHSLPISSYGLHGISSLTLSPDGTKVAYVMATGRETCRIVVDGKPSEFDYAGCSQLVFTEDGSQTAAVVRTAAHEVFLVVGDREYGPFGGVADFRLSPDGRFAVCRANKPGDYATDLYLNGRLLADSQNLAEYSLHRDGSLSYISGLDRFKYEMQYAKAHEHLPHLVVDRKGVSEKIPLYGPPLSSADGGPPVLVVADGVRLPEGLRSVQQAAMPLRLEAYPQIHFMEAVHVGGAVAVPAQRDGSGYTLFVNAMPTVDYHPTPFPTRFVDEGAGAFSFFGVQGKTLVRIRIDAGRSGDRRIPRSELTAWPSETKSFSQMETSQHTVAVLEGSVTPSGSASVTSAPDSSTGGSTPSVASAAAGTTPGAPTAQAPALPSVPPVVPGNSKAAQSVNKVVGEVGKAKQVGQAIGSLFKKKKPANENPEPPR